MRLIGLVAMVAVSFSFVLAPLEVEAQPQSGKVYKIGVLVNTGPTADVAMFTIIAAMAQLERDIIRERVTAGLERARTRGRRLGRPRVEMDLAAIRQLRADGHSLGAIARRVRRSRATLRRRLRAVAATEACHAP